MVKGFLHIVTTPVSGDIYINDEYRGTFDLNIETDPGIYIVSFGNVDGYITPSPLTVTVNSDYTTIVTAQYILDKIKLLRKHGSSTSRHTKKIQ